jgi:hypothetical protein
MGLVNFLAGNISHRGYRRCRQELSSMDIPMVEAPSRYVRWLMEEAKNLSESKGVELPKQFRECESILDAAEPVDRTPILDELPMEDIKQNRSLLLDSVKLFEEEVFSRWVLEPDWLDKLELGLKEIEQSDLYINEEQRREQMIHTSDKIVREYFDDVRRKLFKERLIKMAYFFWLGGRREVSERCLAAGLHIGNLKEDILQNPFACQFIKKSFKIKKMDDEEDESQTEGKIILP